MSQEINDELKSGEISQSGEVVLDDAGIKDVRGEEEQLTLDSIAFIGNTLSPFFLQDSKQSQNLFEPFLTIELENAAHDWPFVNDTQAQSALLLMMQGVNAPNTTNAPNAPNTPNTPANANASLSSEVIDALSNEYKRLFIGPGSLECPPWGSVYTDRECVIFGKSTTELHEWMRAQGIQAHTQNNEPKDHIGIMLALMAYIASACPECLDEYLSHHFFTWAPHYLKELENAAKHPFYTGLARITHASFAGIASACNISVVEPHFYR